MIAVTGAGGKTGKAVIKSLSKIEPVCALVYHEELVDVAKALGAERVVVGDLRDPSAIRSAMQGARGVYHICPNLDPEELEIGRLVIDLAREAGVAHFVYHSVLHPQTEKMTHHWRKLRVEEAVLQSGMPFTILQPAPYMQNWLNGWQTILEQGVLRVPYSVHAKFSFVDLEDVAEAAGIVLTERNHLYATYELAGTALLSHVEVAQIMSSVLNRSVKAKQDSLAQWRNGAETLSSYAVENLAAMFDYYDRWGLAGNPNVLTWLLGREPTSVESMIRRTVMPGGANL